MKLLNDIAESQKRFCRNMADAETRKAGLVRFVLPRGLEAGRIVDVNVESLIRLASLFMQRCSILFSCGKRAATLTRLLFLPPQGLEYFGLVRRGGDYELAQRNEFLCARGGFGGDCGDAGDMIGYGEYAPQIGHPHFVNLGANSENKVIDNGPCATRGEALTSNQIDGFNRNKHSILSKDIDYSLETEPKEKYTKVVYLVMPISVNDNDISRLSHMQLLHHRIYIVIR